jgi:hypothetical protein
MYIRYVSDDHHPTCMMVLSDAPLSFIAIAPPALRLCNEIWFRVYPCVRRQSHVAPHCTAVPMSWSETWECRPDALYTAFSWHLIEFACWMLDTRRAKARTGHIGPPIASWCTTAPLVPFLVCAIDMVALSACKSACSPAECRMIFLWYHNLTSQFLEGDCSLSPGAMWRGVFPHSEEVEECYYDQVRDCF